MTKKSLPKHLQVMPTRDVFFRNFKIVNPSDQLTEKQMIKRETALIVAAGRVVDRWYATISDDRLKADVLKSSVRRAGKSTGAQHNQRVYPIEHEDTIKEIIKKEAKTKKFALITRNTPDESVKPYLMERKMTYVQVRPIKLKIAAKARKP